MWPQAMRRAFPRILADKLAVVVRGQPELERVILQQMSEALAVGKADRVYRTLYALALEPNGFSRHVLGRTDAAGRARLC